MSFYLFLMAFLVSMDTEIAELQLIKVMSAYMMTSLDRKSEICPMAIDTYSHILYISLAMNLTMSPTMSITLRIICSYTVLFLMFEIPLFKPVVLDELFSISSVLLEKSMKMVNVGESVDKSDSVALSLSLLLESVDNFELKLVDAIAALSLENVVVWDLLTGLVNNLGVREIWDVFLKAVVVSDEEFSDSIGRE